MKNHYETFFDIPYSRFGFSLLSEFNEAWGKLVLVFLADLQVAPLGLV